MIRPSLAQARQVLQRHFGYADFRPAQLPAIEAILSGRDAVIVLPTGGGKSICFQVPALCFPRLTVVVSPLISLMSDQVEALERRGIQATYLNSTLPPDETAARAERIRRRQVRILYAAPERLVSTATIRLLSDAGVDLFAIDEAHCVSEWGQDFRPGYLRLAAIRRSIGDPQTVALTATATPRVRRDVTRLLELRDPRVIAGGFDRPNLAFRVERVDSAPQRHQAMVRHLRALKEPGVVYAATRRQVDLVTRILSSGGVNAVAYHAGLAAERRARTQAAFMTGKAQVIVATNAFGMGIDKPDVRLVLHYLHSGSLEDYYQEAGRAGRDGGPADCLLLFNASDRGVHDRMREQGRVSGDLLRNVWQCLATLSNGRRRVPVDERFLASQLGAANSQPIADALRVLEDRGVLSGFQRPDFVKVRLLASPLRLECERNALSPGARAVLQQVISTSGSHTDWRTVSIADTGITSRRFDAAITELESRQLVYCDRVASRVVVQQDRTSRAQLERLILQLKRRREVERARLGAMVAYATTLMCRRRYILKYFGDEASEQPACNGCDVCDPRSDDAGGRRAPHSGSGSRHAVGV